MGQIPLRPAATIVVIREQNDVLEILMLRRSSRAAAASGAHVFPGGGVDAADTEVVRRQLGSGLGASSANRRLALEGGALHFYGAALRELFEEAGLLVAIDRAGRPLDVAEERRESWREDVSSGRLTWPDLLEREGLRLAWGEMRYWAHWVTPEGRPRRFDTRFFVAAAPPGQVARADGGEIVDLAWTSASEALRRYETGQWSMLVPTVHTLRVLASMRRIDEVMDFAARSPLPRTQPREIERDGRLVVVLPGEPGYED